MARTKKRAEEAAREESRGNVVYRTHVQLESQRPTVVQGEIGEDRYSLPAAVLPCLALHNRHKASVSKRHWAGLLSCKWNARKPDPSRFGYNVEKRDTTENLLHVLGDFFAKKGVVSPLDGPPIILALTSFEEIQQEVSDNTILFERVLEVNGQVRGSKIAPIPITAEIITNAMKWLCPHVRNEFEDVDSGIKCYLDNLSTLFPSTISHDQIQKFIDRHEWDDEFLPQNWRNYTTLRSRQFLYDNIAWQTKIVAHVVDGLHRFTAVDMWQITYPNPESQQIIVAEEDSLKGIHVTIKLIVLKEEITLAVVERLLVISAESQANCALQEEHSILQFLSLTIPEVHKASYTLAQWNWNYSENQDDLKRNLSYWTENNVDNIKDTLRESNHLNMISHDGHESAQEQFSKLDSWFKKGKEKELDIFPFTTNDTVISMIKARGNLFYDCRFGAKVTPVLFVVAHLLLWSCLTEDTSKAIQDVLNFFSRHQSYNQAEDNRLEKQRNIELFFHSVVDAVLFSYHPWKTGFFVCKNTHEEDAPMRNNPPSVIYACLLISAIKEQSKAFIKVWDIPSIVEVWDQIRIQPQDFQEALTANKRQMNEETAQSLIKEMFDPFPNVLTFLVVAHGIHMGSKFESCKQDKQEYRTHFNAHKNTPGVELPNPKERNPFDRESQGQRHVSIIGSEVSQDISRYTTRLLDFLTVFLESATNNFDFERAKRLFAGGLIERFWRRFPQVVAPPSDSGLLGLLSDTAVGLSSAANQEAPSILTGDALPNEGEQQCEGSNGDEVVVPPLLGQTDSHILLLPKASGKTILLPPTAGKTWAEVRKRVLCPASNDSKAQENPLASDDSKAEEDPPASSNDSGDDSDDSTTDHNDSGKKRKNTSGKKRSNNNSNIEPRKRRTKKPATTSPATEHVPDASDSPLLPNDYKNLEKLCAKLHQDAPLGLCFRNLGVRDDTIGDCAACLLDKIDAINSILAKYRPIINNGTTTLGEMLHEVGQQVDHVGEEFARRRTEETGRDADESRCESFPEEQSPTGNRFILSEANEDNDEDVEQSPTSWSEAIEEIIFDEGQQQHGTGRGDDYDVLSLASLDFGDIVDFARNVNNNKN